MADSPEPLSRRSFTASSTSHLQYPTLPPLSGSVEEWLSRSRPISMTSTPPTDHSPKSLSESWATLSASDVHSEDGAPSEHTDVGSLIDQTGPDDVASLDERYSSNDDMDGNYGEGLDDDDYDSRSEISESQELRPMFPQIGCSIDDSSLTTHTAFRQSTETIEFIEPDHWPEVERVELKHTIRLFADSEITELGEDISSHSKDSTLMATIQQTVTKKSIDNDKPFRVLYVGSSEFRSIILDKLGDVLVSSTCSGFESSSTESSRYHVVPTSFGAGAVPNFAELLPIHVQLIVDECLEASTETKVGNPNTINLKLKNRPPCKSLWTGTEYCISSSTEWTLPDVAIIFISTLDTESAVNTQKLARILMERHGVPTMAISEKPLWTMSREPIPVNHHSLHMCLESRQTFTGKSTVLKRYPIDLDTFESIIPGQLNRNLASLRTIYSREHNTSPKILNIHGRKTFLDMKKYTRKVLPVPYLCDDTELAFMLRLIAITLLSTVTLTLGFSALKVFSIFISNLLARSVVSSQISPASSICTTSIFPTEDLKQTSIPVLSSATSEIQFLGNQPDKQSQLGRSIGGEFSPVERQKASESFEVQVVGDCHLVIKPPQRSSTGKKQPKFGVEVNRWGNPLQYELSRLFEGVYSLRLDREEAYGVVNVTITTTSKPPVKQTTSVDLGTPWLKIANWKRAAHAITSQLVKDLNTAQTGLSEAYDRISTDLQVLVGDVVKKAHVLRREADLLRRDSAQLSHGTREAVLSTSKQLSEVFKRNAVQPFLSASSVLHGRSNKVNTEARHMVSGTWSRISAGAQRLDLRAVMDHIRNARKSKALDKAQKRARRLLRGKTS